MKTNAIISLDTRREKKGGTYPLVLRITHNRTSISIPLGFDIRKGDFDEQKREVKKSYKGEEGVVRLNKILLAKKAEALDIIAKLTEKGELANFSVAQIKELIHASHEDITFFDYAQKQIDEMHTMKRHGNARNYKSVLLAVKKFRGGKDFPIEQLNYDFLKKFEKWHLGNGNTFNGLAAYLRGIRAIYNRAVKDGLVKDAAYPFENYKIKTQPTQKRALTANALQAIVNKQIEPGHPCFDARNYFIASFYMYGINFVDMAFLKVENIVDGRIRFKRRKTGKPYDLKISGALEPILSHYLKGKKASDYIFPVLKRKELIDQYKDVMNERKAYNAALKDLAELCEIDEKLTSYVSRHSFATQAMMKDIPLQAISAMLGHSSLKTTEIYLKGLPSDILDDYNARISLG